MEAVLTAIVIYLCASYGVERAIEWKGEVLAFRNPGGLKFPAGEVFALLGALAGVAVMALVGLVIL